MENKNQTNRNEAMKVFSNMMLKASGADITPPAELREQAIQAAELQDNETFNEMYKKLLKTPKKERGRIIQGLILTVLPPSEMMEIPEITSIGIKAILQYTLAHPECRKPADISSIIDELS